MTDPAPAAFARLREVIARLLDPENGCPWDLKQTPGSIKLYILEEVYELLDAVDADNMDDAAEEMGDALFMILFLAERYRLDGRFEPAEALNRAADKMIHRHPHIFGDGPALSEPDQVKDQWRRIKKSENKNREGSLLGGVPAALPALLRAHRLTERAGKVGFDWPDAESVLVTAEEEIAELKAALAQGDAQAAAAEVGDVLFTLANLARRLKINPEGALRDANQRFQRRFHYIEDRLKEMGRDPDDASLAEMDALWAEAKAWEKEE